MSTVEHRLHLHLMNAINDRCEKANGIIITSPDDVVIEDRKKPFISTNNKENVSCVLISVLSLLADHSLFQCYQVIEAYRTSPSEIVFTLNANMSKINSILSVQKKYIDAFLNNLLKNTHTFKI